MVKIVLIGGKAGSGKTFAGKVMETIGYRHFSFAQELKIFVANKYKINQDDLFTSAGKMKIHVDGRSYRQLLIDSAKEIKYFDRDYFTRYVCNRLSMLSDDALVVISDFRYPYEYDFLQKRYPGVVTVRLTRDTQQNIDDPSEKSLDFFNFDIVIENNGDNPLQILKTNFFH